MMVIIINVLDHIDVIWMIPPKTRIKIFQSFFSFLSVLIHAYYYLVGKMFSVRNDNNKSNGNIYMHVCSSILFSFFSLNILKSIACVVFSLCNDKKHRSLGLGSMSNTYIIYHIIVKYFYFYHVSEFRY